MDSPIQHALRARAGEWHIRTAIGRDYSDVPPTLGIMKGPAESELTVRVRVTQSEALLPPDREFAADEEWSRFLEEDKEAQVLHALADCVQIGHFPAAGRAPPGISSPTARDSYR